jgi:IS66 Orf2 like protein
MRKGFASLSLQVQDLLRRDPLCGHLFCFRGRRGNLMKVIWHDGQGACLFMKRLEHGRFLWPSPADGPAFEGHLSLCQPFLLELFGREGLRNPVRRGHRFRCKADSIPVIADSA